MKQPCLSAYWTRWYTCIKTSVSACLQIEHVCTRICKPICLSVYWTLWYINMYATLSVYILNTLVHVNHPVCLHIGHTTLSVNILDMFVHAHVNQPVCVSVYRTRFNMQPNTIKSFCPLVTLVYVHVSHYVFILCTPVY